MERLLRPALPPESGPRPLPAWRQGVGCKGARPPHPAPARVKQRVLLGPDFPELGREVVARAPPTQPQSVQDSPRRAGGRLGGGGSGRTRRVASGEKGTCFAGLAPWRFRGQSTRSPHGSASSQIERKTSWGLKSVWKRRLCWRAGDGPGGYLYSPHLVRATPTPNRLTLLGGKGWAAAGFRGPQGRGFLSNQAGRPLDCRPQCLLPTAPHGHLSDRQSPRRRSDPALRVNARLTWG